MPKRPANYRGLLTALAIVAAVAVGAVLNQTFQHGDGDAAADSARVANQDDPKRPPPLPVNTISVIHEDFVTQTRSYTGTVRARQSSDLAFELPGTITEVNVSEGDVVEAGQTLARLDTRLLEARRAATQAQLDRATAVMNELDAGPRDERIRSARSQVDAAKSDFQLAQSNLRRRQRLFDANAISAEEFDQAKFGLQAARARLDNAKEALSELETGTRKEQLAAQSSTIRQLQSSLNEIAVSLDKSQLQAPFAGTISRRYADNGSIAASSVPVVRLIESDALEALVGLPSDVSASLEPNTSVTLSVDTRQVEATVRALVREIDPVTRTQNVLLDIDPRYNETVVPGELCEWKIEQSVERSGFWLPTSALARGIRGLWSVMVVRADDEGQAVAEKRDIEIVLTESDRVLVRGTLSGGDRIVVDGLHRIADGQRVLASEAQHTAAMDSNELDSNDQLNDL